MTKTLLTKNKQTHEAEVIHQHDLEMVGWGFYFFVDSEADAYKAAYIYRDSPHGVKVEFAGGVQRWLVTVFNESAIGSGIDGARKAA